MGVVIQADVKPGERLVRRTLSGGRQSNRDRRSVRILFQLRSESSRSAWPINSTPSGASTRSISCQQGRPGRGSQVDQEIAAKDHVVQG